MRITILENSVFMFQRQEFAWRIQTDVQIHGWLGKGEDWQVSIVHRKTSFPYAICFLPFHSFYGFAVVRLVKIVVKCFLKHLFKLFEHFVWLHVLLGFWFFYPCKIQLNIWSLFFFVSVCYQNKFIHSCFYLE